MARAEPSDLFAKPAQKSIERWLIGPASLEIKQLQRIAQQNPACAHHARCAEEIEYGHVQPAVKAGKGNNQAGWVFSLFDDEVRALVRQSLSCKK